MKKIIIVGALILGFIGLTACGGHTSIAEDVARGEGTISEVQRAHGYLTYDLLKDEARERAEWYIITAEESEPYNEGKGYKELLTEYREYYLFDKNGNFLGN